MAEKDPRTVTLLGVRFSFTDGLVEKKVPRNAEPGSKPKHSFNIIIPSDGPHYEQNMKRITAALREAGEKEWGQPEMYKTLAEDNPKRLTLKKGEKFKNAETGEVYAGYAGHYAMSVAGPGGGDRRPRLMDRHKRVLDYQARDAERAANKTFPESMIGDVFYSGSFGDVIVSFYGTRKGSNGIFASCEVAFSHETGERMAGGYSFSDEDANEFADFGDAGLNEDDGLGTSAKSDDLDLGI